MELRVSSSLTFVSRMLSLRTLMCSLQLVLRLFWGSVTGRHRRKLEGSC